MLMRAVAKFDRTRALISEAALEVRNRFAMVLVVRKTIAF
jgi:hypothetical protein